MCSHSRWLNTLPAASFRLKLAWNGLPRPGRGSRAHSSHRSVQLFTMEDGQMKPLGIVSENSELDLDGHVMSLNKTAETLLETLPTDFIYG